MRLNNKQSAYCSFTVLYWILQRQIHALINQTSYPYKWVIYILKWLYISHGSCKGVCGPVDKSLDRHEPCGKGFETMPYVALMLFGKTLIYICQYLILGEVI